MGALHIHTSCPKKAVMQLLSISHLICSFIAKVPYRTPLTEVMTAHAPDPLVDWR